MPLLYVCVSVQLQGSKGIAGVMYEQEEENGMMDEEETIEESGADENQTLWSPGNHPEMTLNHFLQPMTNKNDIRDVGSTADFSDFAVFLCFFFDSFLFFFDAVVPSWCSALVP